MSAQSWVETTVPPGYDLIRFRRDVDGKTIEAWGGCCVGDQLVGPEPRDNPAAACRDMWRHWTAAVLRGRNVEWEDCCDMPDMEDRLAECGRAIVEYHRAIGGWMFARVAFRVDHMVTNEISRHRDDVDEAMARFAALVLAAEGPVR